MSRTDSAGHTLLELIIATLLVAILCSIAMPSFQALLERQRLNAACHLLSAQFANARITAITRQRPVSVCASDGGNGCSGDSDWSRGWLTYLDEDKQPQPASEAMILRREDAPASGALKLMSSTSRKAVRFLPDGKSSGSNLRVRICSHDNRLLGEVVVNNLGRIRSNRSTATGDCD